MSHRKLQDLLNTNSQNGRDYQAPPMQLHRLPNIAQTQMSPLGQNLNAKTTRSPSYQNFLGGQNIFYHPMPKNQVDQVCPSPMFQVPQNKNPQVLNSLLQGSRYTAAETNPSNNPSNIDRHDFSNSVGQHFSSLQRENPMQPKNLEELLQRTNTSIPSNSMQSPFTSSMQSPFMGGNNHTSQIQPSVNSEFSNLLPTMTLLETSLQNNNLRTGLTKNQTSDITVSRELILLLFKLVKEESETKIKSAITDLIANFKALGTIGNLLDNDMVGLESLLQGIETQPQNHAYQYQSNPQASHQHTVPLSCGLAMNSINRHDEFNQQPPRNMYNNYNPQTAHIDTARRGLFTLSEPQHQPPTNMYSTNLHHQHQPEHYSHPPTQYSFMSMSNPISNSPINNLGQEMNNLDLNPHHHHQHQHHQNHFAAQYMGQNVILHPGKIDDLANNQDLGSILKQQVPSDEELPGIYSKHERINKILKYKNKIRKWRRQHPVKRIFKGRSQVAGQKPRIKGKFVTIEEYHSQYIKPTTCKREFIIDSKEEDF